MADYTLSAKITGDSKSFTNAVNIAQTAAVNLQNRIGGISQKISSLGTSLSNTGSKITRFETLLAGTTGFLGTQAVRAGASFEAKMSKVKAISGATGSEFDSLTEKAKEMGSKTKFTATEAGEGFEYMAMAGWKTNDMLDGIEGIMNLAAASGEDLGTTSDIVTDALTAFGLKAKDSGHFADILAAASSNANTNVSMMGETFKYVAPIAGSLGYSAEDTAQAIGVKANSGIKASQAGTSLRSVITRLATNAGASKNSLGALEILTKKLGVSFYDSQGKARKLGDVLTETRKSWKGLTQEEKINYANKIAGKNAMSGFMALMDAEQADWDKLDKSIKNCNGTCDEMANTMLDNLSGQFTILKSQIEGISIKVFDEMKPTLMNVVMSAQKVATAVDGMISAFSKVKSKGNGALDGVSAALGFLNGEANKGKVPKAFGNIAMKLGLVVNKLKDLKSSGVPLGKLAAGTLALGPAMTIAGKATSIFGGAFSGISKVVGLFGSAVSGTNGVVSSFVGRFSSLAGSVNKAKVSFKALGSPMGGFLNTFKSFGSAFSGVLGVAKNFGGQFTSILMKAFGFGAIGGLVLVGLGLIQQNFGDKIGEILTMVQEKAPGIITNLCNGITSQLPTLIAKGGELISSLLTTLVTLAPSLISGGADIVVSLVNGFASQLPTLLSKAGELIITIVQGLRENLPQILSAGMNVISSLVDGISSFLPELIPAAVDMILELAMGLVDNLPQLIDSGIQLLESVVDGIVAALPKIAQKAPEIIAKLATTLIDKAPQLLTTATKLIMKLAVGLVQAIPVILKKVPEIIKAIKDKFLATDWGKLGKDIMNLVVDGLKSIANVAIDGVNWLIDKVNKLPGFDIPHVPYLLHGTDDWQGGFARMNEGGRGELTYLPNGTQVIPHDISVKYAKEAARNNGSIDDYDGTYNAVYSAVKAAGSGANKDIYITVPVYYDSQKVDEQQYKYNQRQLVRSNGMR